MINSIVVRKKNPEKKIVVIQRGRFHGSHGAQEAKESGFLQSFVTDTLFWKLAWVSSPRTVILGLLERVGKRIAKISPSCQKILSEFSAVWVTQQFNAVGAKAVARDVSLIHLYSGNHDPIVSAAQKSGAKLVMDFGIAHPFYISKAVAREAERWGVPPPPTSGFSKLIGELEQADCVLIPSKFVNDTFKEFEYTGPGLRTISYGVDAERFHPPLQSSRVPGLRVLFAGGISLRKGTLNLLEACLRIRNKGGSISVVLLGGIVAELKPLLGRYVSVIRSQRVVPGFSMPAEYRRADVFVLPSVAEGMSRASLEAMASGLPVVLTPNCGLGGLLEDGVNGFEIAPHDINAIEQSLLKLMDDTALREQMGSAARASVLPFSWKRYRNEVAALYRELI